MSEHVNGTDVLKTRDQVRRETIANELSALADPVGDKPWVEALLMLAVFEDGSFRWVIQTRSPLETTGMLNLLNGEVGKLLSAR